MTKARVLILDDDPYLTEALELWFDKRNYKVEKASDGEEGLLILRSDKNIELVLSDFMMPALNGLALLQYLKASTDLLHIKFLVMSHNDSQEFRTRALQLGALDYLSKSKGARAIVDRVIQTLDGASCSIVEPTQSVAPQFVGSMIPAAHELRRITQDLLNVIQLSSMADGLPPAARAALTSAEELAAQIHAIAS